MTNVLYITRNGLLEPLGQSQVVSYLRHLARDYTVTLITQEKAEDWADSARMQSAHADCAQHCIRWLPHQFKSRPRFIAQVISLLQVTAFAWSWARDDGNRLIHARSYLPAGIAWVVWRLTGTPFIFDMRAFWPEEMITAGRLKRGTVLHRALRVLERRCLRDAAAVVSLTHAAATYLHDVDEEVLEGQRIVVIPTCADLERFAPGTEERACGRVVHGCIGSVLSGWFRLDWLAAWFALAAVRDPMACFEIITRDDPMRVREGVDPDNILGARLQIARRHPSDMPEALHGHDLSVMFYAGGAVSELARSPTRMAEALGCGLPVVANEGVGDVAKIITDYRVGVLLAGPEREQVADAMDALEILRADPNLSRRCRAAADAMFSLDVGVRSYRDLYREIFSESAYKA